MKKYKFVAQQDEKDCGVACLSMIFKFYGMEIPIHKLREISGTDMDGTSAFGLKKCAEHFNYDVMAIQADSSIWTDNKMRYPTIAHIVVNNTCLHYVVIFGLEKNKLIVGDPASGIEKKSIIDFASEWSGVTLLIYPSDNFVPIVEKKKAYFLLYQCC